MSGIIQVACDRCDYQQRLTERPRDYLFPGRQRVGIQQTLAWCRRCARVVEAERLPRVDEIEEQISDVTNGAERVRNWLATIGRTASEELQWLEAQLAWRCGRRAPPKCLECGSTDIELFPEDENEDWQAIEHSDCGGRLSAGGVGMALDREWPPLYSPEGDFLTALLDEGQWQTWSDPGEMLSHMAVGDKASNRKLRLFACACCRRIWEALTDEASRRAVEVSEQYADRQVKSGVRQQAENEARAAWQHSPGRDESWKMYANYAAWHTAMKDAWAAAFQGSGHARCAAMWFAEPYSERGVGERQEIASKKEGQAQCELLRDIFGTLPFRAVCIDPAWLRWNDGTVVRLAAAIYEERRYEDMPILADALEDSGCADQDILSHCRGPGPHTRGCWVVDILLDKE